MPKLCNQCDNPPCVQVCPGRYGTKTPDGVVLVDRTWCIGCGYCIMGCPYGVRFFHPVYHCRRNAIFCYHRITKGLKTACVEACPFGARRIGNIKDPDDPVTKIIMTQRVGILKEGIWNETAGLLPRPRQGGAMMLAHGEIWTVKELFAAPNEYIYWAIQIVMYPFMTGLVAGAFVLSSLYHVFGVKQLKDMARFAPYSSFALALFVRCCPSCSHRSPVRRGVNVLMTPHTSAIAAFGIGVQFHVLSWHRSSGFCTGSVLSIYPGTQEKQDKHHL